MDKYTAVWSGWQGGPGYSNFYTAGNGDDSQMIVAQDRVHDFFAAITLCLPTPITITFNSSVQNIASDGSIIEEKPLSTVAPPVVGAGGSNFSAVSGAVVNWRTSNTVNGRLLRGKTFLVPLAAAAYDTDGTILAARLTELRAAATALATPGAFADPQQFVVWHRPATGFPGEFGKMQSATVPDRTAILKSRRS